jgi:hypothetical protein
MESILGVNFTNPLEQSANVLLHSFGSICSPTKKVYPTLPEHNTEVHTQLLLYLLLIMHQRNYCKSSSPKAAFEILVKLNPGINLINFYLGAYLY